MLAGILLSLAVLAGCASSPPKAAPRTQDTIVLLPDASGKTGSIVVSGGGQEVRLSETNQAVVVREGSAPGKPFERKLGEGTFALQGHDPKSVIRYRNIRVKRLE